MHFGGLGIVADALGELGLGGVKSSDGHQVAAENFVGFGVLDVELERFCEGLNRFAELALREQSVAEGVPAPGGFRVLFDVGGQEGLDVGEAVVSDVAFKLGMRWGSSLELFSTENVSIFSLAVRSPGLSSKSFAEGFGGSLGVALFFEDGSRRCWASAESG